MASGQDNAFIPPTENTKGYSQNSIIDQNSNSASSAGELSRDSTVSERENDLRAKPLLLSNLFVETLQLAMALFLFLSLICAPCNVSRYSLSNTNE